MPHCGIIGSCAILISHYKLLCKIVAYKQSQYIDAYFSMQELWFTQAIKVQACHAREVYN